MKDFKTYGVWIDKRRAYLLEANENDDNLEIKEILSNVDEGKLKGGSRSKTTYGPMDVSAEPQHNRRKQLQIDRFLKAVIEQLQLSDSLLIFGPGEIKNTLKKLLQEKMPAIKNLQTIPAPKLSEKQMKAMVRDKLQLS